MLTHMRRRWLLMLFALAALLSYSGLQFAAQPASADQLVSLSGCSAASGSGGGQTCNLQLMTSIDNGGAWKVTISDTGATVTACDGSASNATCTTSGNTATFTCGSNGCAANSKYTVTVQGDNNPQNVFFSVVSLGQFAGGSGVSSADMYSTSTSYTARPAYTTASVTSQPTSFTIPPGGQCVNGSYPTQFGCTAPFTGPLTYPNWGYSNWGSPFGWGGSGIGCFNYVVSCAGAVYPTFNVPTFSPWSFNNTGFVLGNCNGFFLINGCGSVLNNGNCGFFLVNSCGNFFNNSTLNQCANFIFGFCNSTLGFCGGSLTSNCNITSCAVLNACMTCSSFSGTGCVPNTTGKNLCLFNSFFVYSC